MQQSPLNETRHAAFLDDLERSLSTPHSACKGLLLVQVRGIADLNFALGYRNADIVLSRFAHCLAEGFQGRARIVRVGPGRFAILLLAVASEAHAVLAANKVRRIAESPVDVADRHVKLDVVQGIALFPQHGKKSELLCRNAEQALEFAERSPDAVTVYDPDKLSSQTQLHAIDVELAYALEHGHLEVHFQPQVDVGTGHATGAEALVRCKDRSGAPIAPEMLIRAAERTGRMREVTSAVCNMALRYAAEWPNKGRSLSVNASAVNFKDDDFVPFITSALKIWNWPPHALTIEITESVFIEDAAKTFATMRGLRGLGVRVAIDDFGAGYSSLSYFRDIPANELKIDKSFVLGMLTHKSDREIVRAVINLAHAFDLEVVAEGVENEQALQVLRDMRCDKAQGYHIGRPMAPIAFSEWINAQSASFELNDSAAAQGGDLRGR